LLVELLAPQAGERLLDFGTGSGGLAGRAADRGAECVGVDVAPDAIEEARVTDPGVRFLVADAADLPFDDASFVVASAFGVNFASDHATAAAELARVCRSGGRIGLTVMPQLARRYEDQPLRSTVIVGRRR
jgi:ubiquinone/menaquinone biosynthesis C-methylase UbiE